MKDYPLPGSRKAGKGPATKRAKKKREETRKRQMRREGRVRW